MSKAKIFGITILSILLAICVGIDAWWVYVYFYAPNKTIVRTFNIDLQTLSSGEQKPLIEVQLFRAKEGKGIPAFEIRYNTVTDESRSAFYSYGAQYLGSDFSHDWTGRVSFPTEINPRSGFDTFYNSITEQNTELLATNPKYYGSVSRRQYYYIGLRQNFINAETYYYQSGSDFYNAFGADKLLEDNAIMTATIKTGNTDNAEEDYDIIGVRFKAFNFWDYNYPHNWELERDNPNSTIQYAGKNVSDRFVYLGSDSKVVKKAFPREDLSFVHYYGCYDSTFLATYLYDGIKNYPAGTNSYDFISLKDYLDFAPYESGKYDWKVQTDNPKVEEQVRSYCSIKVTVHDTGLTKAEQSLFKNVRGSTEFNLTNDYTEDSYFIGRTNVNLTAENFIFVNVIDNKYAVKLKQSFVDYYSKYEDLIVLSINLDLESLKNKNIEVVGYTEDCGLENFVIRTSNVPTSEVVYV